MKIYLYVILMLAVVSGCRKYVEIEQPGIRTPKYTADYRYLLDNAGLFEGSYSYAILSGDDTEISDVARQNSINSIWGNVYTWSAVYVPETSGDTDWERLYSIIYNANVVIDGVLKTSDGTDPQRRQLYAEALVHRAHAYLVLLNLYSKQFDAATAANDLGVPLLLTPDLYASLNRATVSRVYEQIIKDLQTSLISLPKLADYNNRPSKVAGYALLSEAYLNMRLFNQASLYADSVLNLKNTLLDLKNYNTSPGTIPRRLADPEIILSKIINGSFTGIPVSSEVLNLLGTNDLRYVLFTRPGTAFFPSFTGRGYWRYTLNGEFVIQTGPSVPETMLIKAECLARAGDVAAALTLVNNLRKKRFLDANYTALTATDANAALKIVMEERKREFFGKGFRWFDQRRYNKDAGLAETETRVFKGTTYTLTPNSNRYVYPIGQKYIQLNPELLQNPR